MQIRNKIFPYPILNNDRVYSNFIDASFEIVFEPSEEETAYKLKGLHFSTDSDFINKLFDNKKIEIILVIECSATVFRKAFKISRTPQDITLRKVDFTEKVEISMFACATETFKMQSSEFDEDYQGIEFEIEKYDILCANDGFNVRFKHDESEGNLVKSIFSVVPSDSISEDTYDINCEMGKKITIALSEEEYKNFKIVNTVPLYREVVFNMLLVPSLIQALSLCIKAVQDNSIDLEELGARYIWFRSIQASYVRLYGKELTIDELRNTSPILLAQQLLGNPLGQALNKMVKEINNINGGDEE